VELYRRSGAVGRASRSPMYQEKKKRLFYVSCRPNLPDVAVRIDKHAHVFVGRDCREICVGGTISDGNPESPCNRLIQR